MKTLVTKSNCSMGLASYFFSSFGGGSGRKDQVIFQRDNNVLGERMCFVLTMSASVGARKGLVRVHNQTKQVHMGDMKTRQCNFIFTHTCYCFYPSDVRLQVFSDIIMLCFLPISSAHGCAATVSKV